MSVTQTRRNLQLLATLVLATFACAHRSTVASDGPNEPAAQPHQSQQLDAQCKALKPSTRRQHLRIRVRSDGDGGGCESLAIFAATGSPADARAAREAGQIMRLFQQSCDGHIAMACRRLAEAYELGAGVPVDPERAAAFNRRACDLGQQSACAGSRW